MQQKDQLAECDSCVICGSKVNPYFAVMFGPLGEVAHAVVCGNKKCQITGRYARREVTAVKYWNELTLIHEKLHKKEEFFKEKKSE